MEFNGCDKCKYTHVEPWELPCVKCIHAYKPSDPRRNEQKDLYEEVNAMNIDSMIEEYDNNLQSYINKSSALDQVNRIKLLEDLVNFATSTLHKCEDAFSDLEIARTESDPVHAPEHYKKCSAECIDIMTLLFDTRDLIRHCYMTAFEYIWRCKHKNGMQDLEKAEWWIDRAATLSGYGFDDEEVQKYMDIINKLKKEIEVNGD